MASTLVTVLGKEHKEANYELGGQSCTQRLAPLALVRLLPPERRPSRLLALCTPEAKEESWPLLEAGLADTGVLATCVDLAGDPTDVGGFLSVVAEAIPVDPAPASLMIDATHGFRHYALLAYLAIQYLAALRSVPISGAFYGLFRQGAPCPFLDLRALLELPEWIAAIRLFGEAGDARPLAARISASGGKDQATAGSVQALREISEAREAGLPLELGQLSADFLKQRIKPLRRGLKEGGALLEEALVRRVKEPLERFGFAAPASGDGWKGAVRLDGAELRRQVALIDDLIERGSLAVALGMMNEWVVSRVVYETGDRAKWLDYHGARKSAAARLGALERLDKARAPGVGLGAEQGELAEFWRGLSELRNAFHHHGMRPQVLVGSKSEIEKKRERVLDYWEKVKSVEASLPLLEASGSVLVSPIGRKPGVLFSALRACQARGSAPESCLVVESEETASVVEGAVRAACFEGALHRIQLRDAFGGATEIDRVVREARAVIAPVSRVAVNLTGGTTLMGLAVSAIADEAGRLAREVDRFGLIDRRDPGEQDADPYRASEAYWLSKGTGDEE